MTRIALVCLIGVAAALRAQRPEPPLQLGSRVKLIARDSSDAGAEPRYSYPAGFIIGFGSGSLLIRPDSTINRLVPRGDSVRVVASTITYAELSEGRKQHTLAGAASGILLGTVLGYLIGDAGRPEGVVCRDFGGAQFCNRVSARPDKRPQSAIGWGGAGALLGSGIGFIIRTERWRKLDITSLREHVAMRSGKG